MELEMQKNISIQSEGKVQREIECSASLIYGELIGEARGDLLCSFASAWYPEWELGENRGCPEKKFNIR